MSLTLSDTQAIQEIANYVCDFLPGQPHPFANQSISFAGIAHELDLKDFWQGGSKLPAITTLLENTLERKRESFCSLIIEIVRRSIKYRANKGHPITREEIEKLNGLILKVGFKIPELWDKDFWGSLSSTKQKKVGEQEQEAKKVTQEKRKELAEKLLSITKSNPIEKGFAFERFLNELFEVFKLKPRSPFKLTGEQIDGSLELDNETYLIEAKCESKLISLGDLLCFHGKISGKATWTRGIFISYSGFTKEAIEAFPRGRQTNLITITGEDLHFTLNGSEGIYLNLDEVIRAKVRHAAETGNIVTVYELLINNLGKQYAKR